MALKVFRIVLIFSPLLGVILLGWSGFDMMFIYLTEGLVSGFFAVKKQQLINIRSGNKNKEVGSTGAVIFVFGFFYVIIRLMGTMGHAITYDPAPRHSSLLIMFLNFMFAPIISNPEILFIMTGNFITSWIDYYRFSRKSEFDQQEGVRSMDTLQSNIVRVFVIVFVAFTIFWFATLIGSIFHLETKQFTQIVLAIVLLLIQNSGAVLTQSAGKRK